MLSFKKLLSSQVYSAIQATIPEVKQIDVNSDVKKDWDYSIPSAMKTFNMNKKNKEFPYESCKVLADKIVAQIPDEHIEKIDLLKMGKGPDEKSGFFINLTLKNSFLEKQIGSLVTCEEIKYESDVL